MNYLRSTLYERLKAHSHTFHPVVDFNPSKEKLTSFDFTEGGVDFSETDFTSTENFSSDVNKKLKKAKAKYGIGGYNEFRSLYGRSKVFDPMDNDEPRRLHLGTDIWGEAGTEVYAPLGGMVHSFANNNNYGDYGATIILLHQLDTIPFYTLYGHLSLNDISKVIEGQYINRGQVIGHFGTPVENGNWPPHLHFQIIDNIELYEGDYPGVCKLSEQNKYLSNCPDPDAILNMMQYVKD